MHFLTPGQVNVLVEAITDRYQPQSSPLPIQGFERASCGR